MTRRFEAGLESLDHDHCRMSNVCPCRRTSGGHFEVRTRLHLCALTQIIRPTLWICNIYVQYTESHRLAVCGREVHSYQILIRPSKLIGLSP
jgi:hypothetical protein